MATVTLADGTKADVSADNWQALAVRQIEVKSAAGPLSWQDKSAITNAFRQLAGMGNGYYTVSAGGAAAPRAMGEAAVLAQPLVRLSDSIMGRENPSSRGVWRDFTDSAAELAANAKAQAVVIVEAVRPPGGFAPLAVVAALGAGALIVYLSSR